MKHCFFKKFSFRVHDSGCKGPMLRMYTLNGDRVIVIRSCLSHRTDAEQHATHRLLKDIMEVLSRSVAAKTKEEARRLLLAQSVIES